MVWNLNILSGITATTQNQNDITQLYNQMIDWINYNTKDEELSNDIFMKIIRSAPKFTPKKGLSNPFIAMCKTILKNEIIENYKRNNRKRRIQLKLGDLPKWASNITDDHNQQECDPIDQIEMVLSNLPLQDKNFVLKYIHSKQIKHPKDRIRFHLILKELKK